MMRAVLIRLAVYPVVAYLTIGVTLLFEQSRLLFPAPKNYDKSTPVKRGLPFEDLRIPVNARDQLHAWWLPARAAPRSPSVILAFHGNGYVLEDTVWEEAGEIHQTGADALLMDYRGYGSSSPIHPNERTVDDDAEAALQYLLRTRGVPIDSIFLIGRSIGSGPATYLAANHAGIGGLVLESPFTSIDDAAAAFLHFPISLLSPFLRTHFDNLVKIDSVGSPVLVVVGTEDILTPRWMAERIFARANEPKQLYEVPGAGHNDLLTKGGDALTEVLRKFVQRER